MFGVNQESTSSFSDNMFHFGLKWAPRSICAYIGARYFLGYAYEVQLMAKIDRVCIVIIRHFFGRTGIGTAMPTVHWYCAIGVQTIAGVMTALLYDLTERIIRSAASLFHQKNTQTKDIPQKTA